MKNTYFTLALIILATSFGKANGIDTSYGNLPAKFYHPFVVNMEISNHRIKSKHAFTIQYAKEKRVFSKLESIYYDRKWRIKKIVSYKNLQEDTKPYSIRYYWMSDTLIEAKIIYDKGNDVGKVVQIVDEHGVWKRTVLVSRADSGKAYVTKSLITLNQDKIIKSILNYDADGHVYQVCLLNEEATKTNQNTLLKSDTLLEEGKIKSILHREHVPNHTKRGHTIEAYNSELLSTFQYDSMGRVKEIYTASTTNNHKGFQRILYNYDTGKMTKLTETQDSNKNMVGNRYKEVFYYNYSGAILRKTKSRDAMDSLIDEEEIHTGNTTLRYDRRRLYDANKKATVESQTEYKYVNGLIREILFYMDKILMNEGYLYKYKKRHLF